MASEAASLKSAGPQANNNEQKSKSVLGQINELKSQIDGQIDSRHCPLQDLRLVLLHLRWAEDSLSKGPTKRMIRKRSSQDDESGAWYDLVKAKFLYRQIAEHQEKEIDPHVPDDLQRDVEQVKQAIHRMWYEVDETQRHKPEINTCNAADWLRWAEEALDKDGKRISYVMYCILRAQGSLTKAQECVEKKHRGWIAISFGLAYLLAIPVTVIWYHLWTGEPYEALMKFGNPETILHVPRFVFLWGFLGGVSWCIYNAAYWSKQRLFDPYFLHWYIAHPWVSSVLGGATSLLFIGGLNSLTQGIEMNKPVGPALLSLISFLAGFSTHRIWKGLDKVVAKLFGGEDVERSRHEESQKHVHKVLS